MADNVKPSMSPDGWITSPQLKLDELLSDFYYSEFSQSAIYHGSVASLPYIVQSNQNNPQDTARQCERTLKTYLGRYFENVTVNCTFSLDDPQQNKAAIKIYVEVSDAQGRVFTVSDLLTFIDSKFYNVIRLNNAE